MSDVNTAHEVTVASNAGNALLFFRSPIDRNALANRIAIADYDFGISASITNVLGSAPDYSPGRNGIVFADRNVAQDGDAVDQLGSASDFGFGADDTKWTDFNSGSDFGQWIDARQRRNIWRSRIVGAIRIGRVAVEWEYFHDVSR